MKTQERKTKGCSPFDLQKVLALAALVVWTSPSLLAQTKAPAADEAKKDKDKEETIVLSPFEVS
jgi:hypothetical protein